MVDLPAPGEMPWAEKLNAAITEIDQGLQDTQGTVAGIETVLQSVDADLQNTKTTIANLGASLSITNTDVAANTSAIAEVDGRVDALESASPPPSSGGGAAVSRYVPVVIFNGESNSGGYADNVDATAHELAPRTMVQIFDNVGLASYSPLNIPENNLLDHAGLSGSAVHGWELGLANSVEAGEWWDDIVYLIKTGQGGSRISDWGPTSEYYTKFLTRVRNGLAILRNQGKVPIIYFWYTQGINDAIAGTNEAQWLADTKEYHDRVRSELGYVPIFMTKFQTQSIGANYNDSMDAYAAEDNMLITVDGQATTKPDNHHWDYPGMKLVASRMCAASKAFGQHEGYTMRQMDMLGAGTKVSAPGDLPALVRSPATVTFVEGSAGATFTVKLSTAPAANVVVTVSVVGGNVQANKSSLTFTPANYGADQTVTVTSPDDNTESGSRSATVTLSSVGVSSSATVAATVTDAFVAPGPVNTALPAITGTTDLGDALTASSGTWTGAPTSYAYQWLRDALPIAGETTNSHVVVAADQGHMLSCAVSATNAAGTNTATSVGVSVPVDLGALVPFSWTDLTNITEDANHAAVVGSAGGTTGANATTTVDVSVPFVVIVDWASSTDANAFVTFLDDEPGTSFSWSGESFTTGAYLAGGSVNSATAGNLAAIPWGWTPPSFPCKVKCEKSGNDVVWSSSTDGGTTWTPRYTHLGVLAGKGTQYVRVLAAVPVTGQKLTVFYDADMAAPSAPVNTVPPIVTGSAALAGVLTCSAGSWSQTPTSYAYQWKRNGADIAGETANSHTVVAADQGQSLTCTVTATNAIGSTSATTTAIPVAAAGGLTLTPVTWVAFTGTDSPQPGVIRSLVNGTPCGALASGTIDVSQPWEVELEYAGVITDNQAIVIYLDDDNTQDYSWGAGQVFVIGGYQYGGDYNWADNGGTVHPIGTSLTLPCKIKMAKSGNDVAFSRADGAAAYGAPFATAPGVLTGKGICYIKALFAVPNSGQQIMARKAQ